GFPRQAADPYFDDHGSAHSGLCRLARLGISAPSQDRPRQPLADGRLRLERGAARCRQHLRHGRDRRHEPDAARLHHDGGGAAGDGPGARGGRGGARPWQTVWRVTLPVLWPALLAAAIYVATIGFAAFDVPAILGLSRRIFT